MKSKIGLVLIALAVLSVPYHGQENVANYCKEGCMDEKASPILVSDSSLQSALSRYPLFVLEGFADWCGNCKEMNITLSELSADLEGQVVFGLINVEMNNDTRDRYSIADYPTLLIFKNGVLVDTQEGYQSEPDLARVLKKLEPDLDISHINVTAQNSIVSPTSAGGWFDEGTALYNLGRYNESIEAFNRAIELDPKNEEIWNNYGLDLYSLYRYDEAIKAYEKAIEINASYADAWNNKGAALAVQGEYEKALEAFDKATKIDPGYAKAWNNKGKALRLLNRDSEADIAFAMANEMGYSTKP